MYRIKNDSEHMIEIEKSKFTTYLFRIFKEEDAKLYIQQIKKMHPSANHHCYAFIIGDNKEIQRSNDDGEPSGTAGLPMLESLRKNDMQDTLAICVRYFGGIKLGAGGLIRAYSKSVSLALQHTIITKSLYTSVYRLTFTYDFINQIDYYFHSHNICVLDKSYDVEVTYVYHTLHDCSEDIIKMSSAKYSPIFIRNQNIEETITP